VLEAVKRGANGIIEIPVAGCKLITEQVQDGEVDGVRTMSIGRMDFGLDVTGIIKQDVKDIMALELNRSLPFTVKRFPF
jgi:hypothetical protein